MTSPARTPGRLPDPYTVAALITRAADELVLPRFRHLASGDIETKATRDDPDDVVTAVDKDVERRLTSDLAALTPGVPVLGEEAAFANPRALDLLASDGPVWVIDPIDGTRNFAAGDDGFGIMVAFVLDGHTRAAWIALPARGTLFVGEEGSGVRVNGVPVRVPAAPDAQRPRGTIHSRYMPPGLQAGIEARVCPRFEPVLKAGCAAVEYTTILTGAADFALYFRLLPWDHAAPAFLLTEAGGEVAHVAGGTYTPRSPNQLTVVGGSPAIAQQIRGWLADL